MLLRYFITCAIKARLTGGIAFTSKPIGDITPVIIKNLLAADLITVQVCTRNTYDITLPQIMYFKILIWIPR